MFQEKEQKAEQTSANWKRLLEKKRLRHLLLPREEVVVLEVVLVEVAREEDHPKNGNRRVFNQEVVTNKEIYRRYSQLWLM